MNFTKTVPNGKYRINVLGLNGTLQTIAILTSTETGTIISQATPGVPTGVTATAGSGKVTLSWTAPSVGDAPDGYHYRYRRANNGTAYSGTDAAVGTSWTHAGNVTSKEITGLTNGLAYVFEVRAYNGTGTYSPDKTFDTVTGSASASVTAVPNAKPTSLTAAAGSNTGDLDLSWTAPASGTQILTDYEYCYGTTAGHCATSSATWTSAGADNTTETITGLTGGTTYYVQVRAIYGPHIGTSADEASGAAKA